MCNYDESWDYEEDYRASQPHLKKYHEQMEMERWFAEFQQGVNSVLGNMKSSRDVTLKVQLDITYELNRLCREIKARHSYPITLAITCARPIDTS